MENYIYNSKSENDTKKLAIKMASMLKKGDLIVLCGELGSGKTKFTEGFLTYFGLENEISSPTFTIVNEYKNNDINIYHFDVYRIGDVEEMDEVGFDEYVSGEGVSLIEWANLIEEILPETYREVQIEKDLEKGFDYRKITILDR